MTIAEKLLRAKADLDAVYAAGKAAGGDDPLKYATGFSSLFADSQFPDGYELVVDITNASANIGSMFRRATGIKKLTLRTQTTKVYNAGYFFYGTGDIKPSVVEIVLPDGIKFSDFGRFAGYCNSLKAIHGSINLSECTTVLYCFMDCYDLEEVRFVPGTIGLSIDLGQSSKLSDASVASIVDGLATVTTSQTLKLHATTKGKLTESQIATITQTKGWTLA